MSLIARAKSVKGSLRSAQYKEQENKKSIVIVQENMTAETPAERWEEMKIVSKINKRTEKPFVENVLSPIKEVGDKLTEEDWRKLAIDFAEKMGYRENQWYAVLHRNTDERHLHLIVNRIGFNGKNTINDHRIGERAGKTADKLAKERGLKTAKELTNIKRNNIKETIQITSQNSTSWADFQERMKLQGYYFQLNFNTKGLNGARVIPLEEIKENPSKREELSKKGYTLSSIDRKLKVNQLQLIFEQNQRLRQEQERNKYRGFKR